MKIAPLYHALIEDDKINPVFIHTGQHYDNMMSDMFLKQFKLKKPDFSLNVGSHSHAQQTAMIMQKYDEVLDQTHPDLVVVVGDVNSTIATALTACKRHIKVAHLEAGLRSGDERMPEEINRILTDRISDILWTPSPDGDENLLQEGIEAQKIKCVGNIMIDTLEMMMPEILKSSILQKLNLQKKEYALITLHRPSNVDEKQDLTSILKELQIISKEIQIIFPVHPRTMKTISELKISNAVNIDGLHIIEPQDYISFLNLIMNSQFVLTDSGGIQEETTYLGIPCLTIRDSTERPITITHGTNKLTSINNIQKDCHDALNKNHTKPSINLWDGHTAKRVTKHIKSYFNL